MFWKKKYYPSFWNTYAACFDTKSSQDVSRIRFVVFDTETTGLNIKSDRILSMGCIAIEALKINVSDQLEVYVKQELFSDASVKIHGLLKKGIRKKMAEEQAVIQFLNYIKNAVLVAHHAAFDVTMINQALQRLKCPKLKNTVLDTGHIFKKTKHDASKNHFTLDELANRFSIPLHDRHTASGDAYITALLFLKLLPFISKQYKTLKINHLSSPVKRVGLL